jgi:hypothetical protein
MRTSPPGNNMSDQLTSVEAKHALAELQHIGKATPKGLVLADDLPVEQWTRAGYALSKVQGYLQWWLGDWWSFGEHRYGDRKAVVESDDWDGPAFQTCANSATVCRAFETSRRREVLSFKHHAEVADLTADEADELLDWCEESITTTGKPRSVRELRREKERRQELSRRIVATSPDIFANGGSYQEDTERESPSGSDDFEQMHGEVEHAKPGVANYVPGPDADIEKILRESLHTYVRIVRVHARPEKGRIEIRFFNDEDLKRLLMVLMSAALDP